MVLNKKSWKDINLKEYKKIVEISKRELDSDLEKDIAVLAVLLNVSEQELYNMNVLELKSLLEQMKWIRETKYDFNPNFKKIKKMIIDNKEYIVNPNINNYTVAQYMDFQNFWDKRNDYMGNLLAVFIIPKGYKYNEGYDVIELADRLEEVFSLDDWNNVCFFFLKTYNNLTKASIQYSIWKIQKMIWKEKNMEKKQELKKVKKELQQQIKLLP